MGKRYVAVVSLVTSTGATIDFLCTPGTHHTKIKRIKQDRKIVSEKVRFVLIGPQKDFTFDNISNLTH